MPPNKLNQSSPTPSRSPSRLLGRRKVEEMTDRSRSWIYDAIEHGDFPKPVRVGVRAVAWHEDEVVAWIESRPRAR